MVIGVKMSNDIHQSSFYFSKNNKKQKQKKTGGPICTFSVFYLFLALFLCDSKGNFFFQTTNCTLILGIISYNTQTYAGTQLAARMLRQRHKYQDISM